MTVRNVGKHINQQKQQQMPTDTSTTYNMATKFLQGVSSINQLNSFKESVITRHKEGKLTDMDKAKLENAIVQKEASLL